MLTIYAKISDLLELENTLPEGIENELEVHIVSDLAWENSEEDKNITVVCDKSDYSLIKNIIHEVTIVPLEKDSLNNIKRTFGC